MSGFKATDTTPNLTDDALLFHVIIVGIIWTHFTYA
jgi:hypothetical protein